MHITSLHGKNGTLAGRALKRLLPALCLGLPLLHTGCTTTDTGNGNQGQPDIQDEDRRAGSSSTANFPPPLAGDTATVAWTSDSALTLKFKGTNPFAAYPVSGTISLYKAGAIPALTTVTPLQKTFAQSETFTIGKSWIDSLDASADTVAFNVLVARDDATQGFMMGCVYIRKEGRFAVPGYSADPPSSVDLDVADKYFKGPVVNWDSLPTPTVTGKSEMSYYIPGTEFFRSAVIHDSLVLGPIPREDYPLRLLRVTSSASGSPSTEVEIFEVGEQLQDGVAWVFRIGDRIFDRTFPMAVTIRKSAAP